MAQSILVTGGAGFVGSNLAVLFREQFPNSKIVAFDNLKRRGSELNLARLKKAGIDFCHGDIRCPSDFESLGMRFDVFIEASAEPSVLAGMNGQSPLYAIDTNLGGTIHCLEFARKNCGVFLFLSTSRVYSIPELLKVPLDPSQSRFKLAEGLTHQTGLSSQGISEAFSTRGFRSIYGTTKLSSEMLIEEYVHAYGLKAFVNRCGVIAGPWQMGKVDQGVFTLWMARHVFGGNLKYTGFDGRGFQVRDLLHPKDLFRLLLLQLEGSRSSNSLIYNVGGGVENSISLCELTRLCQEISGRQIEIGSEKSSSQVDIPYYVTDNALVRQQFGWKPEISLKTMFQEIHSWLQENAAQLKPIF